MIPCTPGSLAVISHIGLAFGLQWRNQVEMIAILKRFGSLLTLQASAAIAAVAVVDSACAASEAEFQGKPYEGGDVLSDTWVATDGLGRVLPGSKECGPVKKDKWVGIFYWTWHTPRGGPNDNTKILAATEGGVVHWPANSEAYHWGEPELGYYQMTDPFVIRKHANLLVDAGVDVVVFDTTNPPFTWKEQYEALCREYTAMRRQGARTPAIAFIAPFGDGRGSVAEHFEIHYVVIAEPARLDVSVHIQEQQHPIAAGAGGDFIKCLGEEVHICGIIGSLENHEVVAARLVAVYQVAVPLVIAMKGVADGVPELRLDLPPIIESAINDDPARPRGHSPLAHALEAPYPGG
jgi:hypothetical protein